MTDNPFAPKSEEQRRQEEEQRKAQDSRIQTDDSSGANTESTSSSGVTVNEAKPLDKTGGPSPTALADGSRVEGEDGPAIFSRAQEILKEYNNREAEIPLNSEYWSLMNKYRSLTPKQQKGK